MNIKYHWTKFSSRSLKKRLKSEAQSYDMDKYGWTSAETQFCSLFKPYFTNITKKRFDRDLDFLRLAGDSDVKPMSIFMYVFLFFLVFGESLGFNILLASYIGREVTPNFANIVGVTLAFVVAGLLAYITHKIGAQTKKTFAKRACYREFRELRGVNEDGFTEKVGLGPQEVDADKKSYVRTMNRIANSGGDRGSYVMAVTFAVIVVGFAVLMWGIRHTEMIAEATEEAAVQGSNCASGGTSIFGAPTAPGEMTAAQAESDKQACQESEQGKQVSADLAFGVFSLIFLLTQGVGFYAAFTHTFAGGENSVSAYRNTAGLKSFDDYLAKQTPYIDGINAELKAFQGELKLAGRVDRAYTKTFQDYLQLELNRQDLNDDASQSNAASIAEKSNTAQKSESTTTLAQAKSTIEALAPNDAVIYIKSLTGQLQSELRPWLLERKEQREKEMQKIAADSQKLSDSELKDLL